MKGNAQYEPQKTSSKSNKNSFSKIFRYYFDNAITKSTNFIIFLLLISFILGLLMIVLQQLSGDKIEGSFFDKWYSSVVKILKLSAKGDDWFTRFVTFLYWSFSIAISGTIIGFLSSKIREVVANLKKGKSAVIVKNHTIILGWSNNIFAILKELSIAYESEGKGTVVIFSPMDNEKMQDEIKTISKDIKHLKIVTRSGNPSNTSELEIANPQEAKSIIVLNEGGKNDTKVITTVLALGSMIGDSQIPIIASLKKPSYAEVISDLKQVNVYPVLAEDIVSNVTAQACRQRGLGLVFLDLLDFDGDEIYFKTVSELYGKTYQEALISFDKSSVLGLVSNGEVQLIPPSDTVIKKGDKLILVSEDDDTIHYERANVEQYASLKKPNYQISNDPRNILFIGWSKTGSVILDALTPNLTPDSTITIAYQEEFIEEGNIPVGSDYPKNNLDSKKVVDDFENISQILDEGNYNDVMILGYEDKLSMEEADTTTLLYMLQLDGYLAKHKNNPFRVVAQVLDSSKAKLAQFTKTDELIISDNLAGLLMAQLSENPKLSSVFENLFDDQKANINIYPINKYVEVGSKTTYSEIVYKASLYNESAIGIRRDAKKSSSHMEGLFLNPSKKMILETNADDFVIVIDHP